jgi:class 3 adenylate cyclase
MFRSLRHKLLFWFHGFILLNLIIIGLSIAYFQSREGIDYNTQLIAKTRDLLQEDYKVQANFFSEETRSSFFFEYQVSKHLDRHEVLIDSLKSNLMILRDDDITNRFGLGSDVDGMIKRISLYEGTFNQIVQLILKRGFKEHGLEGQMRLAAHKLESYPEIAPIQYLTLRRNEKDYFLRQENIYLSKVHQLSNTIRKDINAQSMTVKRRQQILTDIDHYQELLMQVVRLDKKIGLYQQEGLKAELDRDAALMSSNFNAFRHKSLTKKDQINANLKTFFLGLGVVLVGVGFLGSFILSKLITDPLSKLSVYINKFVKSDFTFDQDFAVDKKQDEVGKLTRNFMVMKDKIIEQLKYFRQKVEERTQELAEANESLIEINQANSRFVPKEFLNYLGRESIVDVKLGDNVAKDMTVLFSDIRSFTEISEKMSPQENFDFINNYLKVAVPLVRKHGGFIDKYIGDSIMALFPDEPDNALLSSIDALKAVENFNERNKKQGKEPIVIGIGIHTGHLILGTIGAERRMETTVISDAVNIAARMEGLNKVYDTSILVTGKLVEKLKNPDDFNLRLVDLVRAKGKTNINKIYEVIDGCMDPLIRDLKIQTKDDYESALKLYQNKEIKESMAIFKDIAAVNPSDQAARLFLIRCNSLIEKGIPENFDGAEKMYTK